MGKFQTISSNFTNKLRNIMPRPIIYLLILIAFLSPVYSSAQSLLITPQKNIAVFTEKQAKYLYRAKINYKDKQISGIIIIKKSDSNSYRVAMVTELGMKLFEMEFFSNKKKPFVLHSCIKYLNKKIIINTLRKDFESLFINFEAWKKPKIIEQKKGNIYRYCYEGKRDYFCDKYGSINKIIRKSWFRTQEIIIIENIKNPYPKSINIEHQHIDLKIQLHFIK